MLAQSLHGCRLCPPTPSQAGEADTQTAAVPGGDKRQQKHEGGLPERGDRCVEVQNVFKYRRQSSPGDSTIRGSGSRQHSSFLAQKWGQAERESVCGVGVWGGGYRQFDNPEGEG